MEEINESIITSKLKKLCSGLFQKKEKKVLIERLNELQSKSNNFVEKYDGPLVMKQADSAKLKSDLCEVKLQIAELDGQPELTQGALEQALTDEKRINEELIDTLVNNLTVPRKSSENSARIGKILRCMSRIEEINASLTQMGVTLPKGNEKFEECNTAQM